MERKFKFPFLILVVGVLSCKVSTSEKVVNNSSSAVVTSDRSIQNQEGKIIGRVDSNGYIHSVDESLLIPKKKPVEIQQIEDVGF